MMSTIRRAVAPHLSRWRPRVRVVKSDAANDLPAKVLAILDKAMVHRRRCDTNGAERVIVQLPNSPGWYHGKDETRKAIASRFPDLSAEQVDEAFVLLRAVVNAHVRAARRLERGPSWATTW